MKFEIPNKLNHERFTCYNNEFISNVFTFNENCIECEYYEDNSPDECWKKQMTEEYHCSQCNSEEIEIMPEENCYEITCKECGQTKTITENQIKEILKDQYNFIDQDELNQKLEEAIHNDMVEYLIELKNLGRNDLCPCGSGKKCKHCHGK